MKLYIKTATAIFALLIFLAMGSVIKKKAKKDESYVIANTFNRVLTIFVVSTCASVILFCTVFFSFSKEFSLYQFFTLFFVILVSLIIVIIYSLVLIQIVYNKNGFVVYKAFLTTYSYDYLQVEKIVSEKKGKIKSIILNDGKKIKLAKWFYGRDKFIQTIQEKTGISEEIKN